MNRLFLLFRQHQWNPCFLCFQGLLDCPCCLDSLLSLLILSYLSILLSQRIQWSQSILSILLYLQLQSILLSQSILLFQCMQLVLFDRLILLVRCCRSYPCYQCCQFHPLHL